MMKSFLRCVMTIVTAGMAAIPAPAQAIDARPLLRTHALLINVDDMRKAVGFYVDKLGFSIADRSQYPRWVQLKTDDRVRLVLNKVDKLVKPSTMRSQVGLTLQVNDLDAAVSRLRAAGVKLDPSGPRAEGVGNAIYFYDPFGRRVSLMHQTIVKVSEFKEPKIYNFGVLVPDMTAARDFYERRLGFVARSERYLPKDMPLGHTDNTFAFMLHYREGVGPAAADGNAFPFYTMVFETDDLGSAIKTLAANGVDVVAKTTNAQSGQKTIRIRDPFGNIAEVIAKE